MHAEVNREDARELVVFGDTHYASYWDHVADIVAHRDDILNPNGELARFLAQIALNMSDVAVVNLGDSIDYFLSNYDTTTTHAADNRELFYAAFDAAGLSCDEILGNHDYRLSPYNLNFWGLSQINLADQECSDSMARLGHYRLRNPLTELRALGRLGSPVDPLRNFRGFQKSAFAQRASFNCFFLNTGADLFGRVVGLGLGALHFVRSAVTHRVRGSTPPQHQLSIDCAGLDQIDLTFVDRELHECGPETTIIFMHAPLINPDRLAIGESAVLTLQRLHACLRAQGYARNVIAAGGDGLLQALCCKSNIERNILIVAGHVHRAGYILIDKYSLVARQVYLEDLNTAWDDARYIKHITVLPIGALDHAVGGNCTGYGCIRRNGFEEVVLNRFDQNQQPAIPPTQVGSGRRCRN